MQDGPAVIQKAAGTAIERSISWAASFFPQQHRNARKDRPEKAMSLPEAGSEYIGMKGAGARCLVWKLKSPK